jgi:uncharacterized protein YjdB/uracil-DNA glycosylase
MKYFKVFNTENEYLAYISSEGFISPNVSTLRDSTNTWINPELHDYSKDYFTIESLEDNNEIKFGRSVGGGDITELHIAASTDNGSTWTEYTLPYENGQYEIATINSGDKIIFKYISGGFKRGAFTNTYFVTSGSFNVYGNVMSLVKAGNFSDATTSYGVPYLLKNSKVVSAKNLIFPKNASLDGSSHYGMFSGCTSLIEAPELPATTLANGCYRSMFDGCTSLIEAPELPATTLANECYRSMFGNCTNLEETPELPATTLANDCYYYMFGGCRSLTEAPELPATTLATYCYYQMFYGCTSLTTAPELPATTLPNAGYCGMFSGCTSLTTAPIISATTIGTSGCADMFASCSSLTTTQATLSATTLGAQCCRSMYRNCTSLTTAPELLATTLADSCYYDMFNGCSALTTAQGVLPATTLEFNCYRQMFYNCKSLVTAPALSAETVAASACTDMFNGCTALTTVQSELPATTMADYCYKGMFRSCTSLTVVPALPATTLANNCYQNMFDSCKSLTTVPSDLLPATTLTNYCYYQMFQSCILLTTAPDLPARTLTSGCYHQMFKACNKLNYIKCLATDISAENCTYEWVYQTPNNSGCTFVKYITMNDWARSVSGIPDKWDVQNYSDVHVTGVTISSTAETITKGATVTLTATVSPNDAYDKSVTWSSDDTSVATVSSEGVITAVGCGEATITVTTRDGGYTAQCETTVENPVTSVTLNTNVLTILTGLTYQLEATVSPSDACGDKSVTWSSSDSNIASVSNNGLVTAVATGSATVTVTTTVGSHTATCAVEVSEPVAVTSVTLDENAIELIEGRTRQLVATVLPSNATDKSVTWTSSNNDIATVTSDGTVTAVSAGTATITVTSHDGPTASCVVTVQEVTYTSVVIEGASVVSAETCEYRAVCDNVEDVTSSATCSITAGSQYATINPSNGHVTILNGANESSVTIQVVYGNLTRTSTVTLTYVSGATSETETEITTDIGGNTTTVTTTITTYADSSSTEVSETVVTDANGDLVGTTESSKTTNADGSYNGTTTNYDENGDPINGSNVTGDTDGNVSTQTVEYDDSGNTVVIGYDIDTSESESGKTFNHDGVNTDYYAFDVTHGFVLDFDFTMDFSNQPSGQENNQHNVLTAKRATPEPWYGFQLRQTSNQKYIQLGTQFNTGSNINTTINPSSITGNVGTYNLRIIYDPTSTGNTFTCIDTSSQTVLYVSDGVFPDLNELKYLKVAIGYAVNASGNPMRYSNITVQNFELKKLKNVANPTITCEDNEVSISCSTVGASIYYRLNLSGSYSAYTTPITITANTVVQAYATYSGDTSDIIRVDCSYELEEPVISCDGEFVTITCPHVGTTIYYRLDESGSYSAYTTPIEITADTIVEAYSELSGYTSSTVRETCIYIEGVDEPVITCSENIVSISCDTVGAEIYYRLNESGSYSAYTEPFEITATTIVESYATLGVRTSETVNETCTYNPLISHRWHAADISDEYVCSGGNKYYKEYYQVTYDGGETWTDVTPEETRTGSLYEELSWDCNDFSSMYFTIHSLEDNNVIHIRRSGPTNNIENYSLDGGENWQVMTSGSGDKTIATLNSGDTMLVKCVTNAWASDYNKCNSFYSTKNIKVYGNIMSLLYGDNFTGQTSATTKCALCGIFFGTTSPSSANPNTTLVSANNLVLPATTVGVSTYNGMFRVCTNLVDCPRLLPATTLYQDTYSSMFEGCTSLVEGPEIMATTIANTSSTSCMQRMFCMNRNSKVTAAMTKSPVLRIVNPTIAGNTYQQLFCGNGSLTEVTILAEGTNLSFANWLNNVSSSGVIKKLSATTLTNNSVNGKPSGWTYENID